MTLPLIVCGSALLFSLKYQKNEIFKILSINFGIFLSLIGIIFSALNLITLTREKEPLITHQGDYSRGGNWLQSNKSQGLGYSYPPNLKDFSSTKVARQADFSKEILYDVTYNIDYLGNRQTPYYKDDVLNKNNSILFLGDSLTFGEGLNDDQTLSFFIQNELGRSTLNAGMHGYGAHQALRLLEDDDLFKKRTKGHKIKTIIYRSIVDHINRTAGYSPWDLYGPCYELNDSKTVSYKGSFVECGKRDNSFLKKILKRLASTSEPLTKRFFERFTAKYGSKNYPPEDVDRFVAVVSRMNSIAKSKGINFFVVLEDVEIHDELCGQKVPFAYELERRLKQEGLNLILTSNVYTKRLCESNELTISKYDRHPTMVANKLLSTYIINNKLIQ